MSAALPHAAWLIAQVTVAAGSTTPGVDLWEAMFPVHEARVDLRDGSEEINWDATGATQLRMARACLVRREEEMVKAAEPLSDLTTAVRDARQSLDAATKASVKSRLTAVSGVPLDKSLAALESALQWERKRLSLLRKAVALIDAAGEHIGELDVDYIKKLRADVESEAASRRPAESIKALRSLTAGMADFVDGEVLRAVLALREAAALMPEAALVHTYLGSFYYLTRQRQQAIAHWTRALELEPNNEELRLTVKNLSLGFL